MGPVVLPGAGSHMISHAEPLVIYKIILLVSNNNDLSAYLNSLYCMFFFPFNNLP